MLPSEELDDDDLDRRDKLSDDLEEDRDEDEDREELLGLDEEGL